MIKYKDNPFNIVAHYANLIIRTVYTWSVGHLIIAPQTETVVAVVSYLTCLEVWLCDPAVHIASKWQ